MAKNIELTRVYPHSREKVWRALTDAKALSEWLMPNDFQPVVGHKFQFRALPVPMWRGIVDCEVLEVEAPSRLVLSWAGHEKMKTPTRVTWRLEEVPGGTRLTLVHSNFQGLRSHIDRFFLNMGIGDMYDRALPMALERIGVGGYEPFGYWLHDRKYKKRVA